MCGGGSDDRIGSQLHHKQEVALWQETLLLRWPSCEFSTSFLHFLCQMWSLIGVRVHYSLWHQAATLHQSPVSPSQLSLWTLQAASSNWNSEQVLLKQQKSPPSPHIQTNDTKKAVNKNHQLFFFTPQLISVSGHFTFFPPIIHWSF